MKLRLTITTLLFPLISFSQTKEKILVIDTLLTENININIGVRTAIDSTFRDNFEYMDSLTSKYIVIDGYIVERLPIKSYINEQWKLVLPVRLPDSTAIIDLPLDDSGGVISLKQSYFVASDTIRINKLTVFHNCLPDSIKVAVSWFKKYKTGTGDSLQHLKSKSCPNEAVLKHCNQEFPNAIHVTVNQNRHILMPKISSSLKSISWYHGIKKGRRQERIFEMRRLAGKPYTYFFARKRIFGYYFCAELSLFKR